MRKQERHSEEAPIGYLDYLEWHQDKTSDWGWLAIRGELETVEEFYRGLGWTIGAPAAKLTEIPATISPAYGLLQPLGRGYEWIIVSYPWDKIDRDVISRQAQLASKQLTTKTFWTTTIGSEIAYELLDWGDRLEYAQAGSSFIFESKLRGQPGEDFLDGELIEGFPKFQFLIDEILVDLHIYLFPCTVVKTADGCGYLESGNARAFVEQVKELNPA